MELGAEGRSSGRGGRGGTCEPSLSVLIFLAERETDRKSIASFFFSDMKESDRGLSLGLTFSFSLYHLENYLVFHV